MVQRRCGDRGRAPLVRGRRCRGARRDRQRLDPPGPDQRPARIGDFGPYGLAAGGRAVSTRLLLPAPPDDALRLPWALRSTDLDAHGHVNNAVYWQAVEDWLAREGVSLAQPHRTLLDYRDPIDLGDAVDLAAFGFGAAQRCLAFVVGDRVRAVASVEPLAAASSPSTSWSTI